MCLPWHLHKGKKWSVRYWFYLFACVVPEWLLCLPPDISNEHIYLYNFEFRKQYQLQCPSHNIVVFRCYFLFSYFCNAHIGSSPWGPQVPNKISALFVETSDSYTSHKETSLGNPDDGQEGIFGDLSYMSANKEGWYNYIQE